MVFLGHLSWNPSDKERQRKYNQVAIFSCPDRVSRQLKYKDIDKDKYIREENTFE